MFRIGKTLHETDIGSREARKNLSTLLDSVESGNQIIHVTRRGERIGALVSPEVAEGAVAIRGPEGPAIPGDLVAAIRIVEGLLAPDEVDTSDLMKVSTKRHGLAGACMSLIDVLFRSPELQDGELDVEHDDGRLEIRYVADLLVRKLYNRPDIRAVSSSDEFSMLAGSLWAAQAHVSAADYRLRIPVEVSATEAFGWILALWELCQLINVIHGDGTAERLMYEAEEFIRESFAGSQFEVP